MIEFTMVNYISRRNIPFQLNERRSRRTGSTSSDPDEYDESTVIFIKNIVKNCQNNKTAISNMSTND